MDKLPKVVASFDYNGAAAALRAELAASGV